MDVYCNETLCERRIHRSKTLESAFQHAREGRFPNAYFANANSRIWNGPYLENRFNQKNRWMARTRRQCERHH